MDTTETNPEKNQSPKQLGDLLKSYRETANMDISQAADTLCLTEGTVRLLENEEFDKLPEAPYLRGYLRGYAKLANINSAEVIALYESMRNGSSAAADTQYNFTPSSSVDDYIKPLVPSYLVQLGTFAIVLLVFAIIYMIPGVKQWTSDIWEEFSQQNVLAEQENSEAAPKQIEQTSLDVASVATTQQQNSITPNTNSGSQKAENTQEVSVKNLTDDEKSSSERMEGTIKRKNTNDNSETADSGTNTENVASKQQQSSDSEKTAQDKKTTNTTTLAENTTTTTETSNTETSSTIDPNAQAPAAPTAAETTPVDMTDVDATAGEVMVKLVFKEEVWMRVNSKRKKVFSGLKKAGDAEEFKTKKPLSFKVGNAPGVDIYVNGKLYDQTPHMRGVVAKFKVDDI